MLEVFYVGLMLFNNALNHSKSITNLIDGCMYLVKFLTYMRHIFDIF